MEIYQSDLFSLIFFIFGLILLFKGEVIIHLESGKKGTVKFVANKPVCKKEIKLNTKQSRYVGILFIFLGVVAFHLIKVGDLIFSI